MDLSRFSATDAILGYFYQFRVGLLWSLQRLRGADEFRVTFERLDDVAFTRDGASDDLLQTKHHLTRAAALTDASRDLWKSLRVWSVGRSSGEIASAARLYLLTTARAPAGSAAACLRTVSRDVPRALALLDAVAATSSDSENASAYEAFVGLSAADRASLLESVVVLDAEPTLTDLDGRLRAELVVACDRRHLEAFTDHLEAWWLRRVLRHLLSPGTDTGLHSAEIEQQLSELRQGFRQDSLPIDADILATPREEAQLATQPDAMFVRQLQLVGVAGQRVVVAIWDYYRAFTQRSKWLREELLHVGELARYEARLSEAWQVQFARMSDELGAAAAEAAKQAAARRVLAWAEDAQFPLRPAVTEPFVTRGSLHMLAEELRIGWHPEFRERLAAVLAASTESPA